MEPDENPKMQTPPDFEPEPDFGIENIEKKHSYKPFIWTIIGLLVIAGIGLAFITVSVPGEEDLVACTTDAMQCPDGSYVGRTGPNCEFVCPNDETAGWKTYKNEEYGFEFRYPKDWISTAHSNRSVILYTQDQQEDLLQPDHYVTPVVVISVDENSEIDSLQKFSEDSADGWFTLYTEQYSKTINGHNTLIFDDIGLREPSPVAFIELDGEIIFIGGNNQYKDEFFQILSTFKFIDTADTAGWQTYRNEEFGFEFRYPEKWTILVDQNKSLVKLDHKFTYEFGKAIANIVVGSEPKSRDISLQNFLTNHNIFWSQSQTDEAIEAGAPVGYYEEHNTLISNRPALIQTSGGEGGWTYTIFIDDDSKIIFFELSSIFSNRGDNDILYLMKTMEKIAMESVIF